MQRQLAEQTAAQKKDEDAKAEAERIKLSKLQQRSSRGRGRSILFQEMDQPSLQQTVG